MIGSITAAVLGAALLAGAPAGAVSFTGSYTQDFNTLAASGAGTAVPVGWSFTETGNNANGSYAAGSGSDNADDTYSFGSAGSADRAFGTLRSGNLASTIFAQFENDTGATIVSLTVGYAGEEWRLGAAGRTDRLDFAYSLNGGSFVDVDALDFVTPATAGVGAKDGNAAANRTTLSATIANLALAAGGTIRFRWSDFDAPGADDGLAVDDFTLSSAGAGATVPEPASWAMMVEGFGLLGAALRRPRRAIGFL